MTTAKDAIIDQGQRARQAARTLAKPSAPVKVQAILNIADALKSNENEILSANQRDYKASETAGMSNHLLDRLLLNQTRLESISHDVRTVAALPDPLGELHDTRTLPNGLQVGRRTVPLGVIGAIYESRPNVTIDISVLCLKSGNAIILRGGHEAIRSNAALARLVQTAVADAGLPPDAVQMIEIAAMQKTLTETAHQRIRRPLVAHRHDRISELVEMTFSEPIGIGVRA